jgi:hypothetical protein
MPAFPRIFVLSVSAAAATALTLGIAGVASASGGDEDAVRTCEDFETQKDAQIALDANLLDLANLDIELLGEKNGIACDKPTKDDDEDDEADEDDDKKKDDADEDEDEDEDEDKAEKKDDSDDDSQVKVKPKGGVDTGGWVISA